MLRKVSFSRAELVRISTAGGMAIGTVDLLEVIDIDHDHAEGPAAPSAPPAAHPSIGMRSAVKTPSVSKLSRSG